MRGKLGEKFRNEQAWGMGGQFSGFVRYVPLMVTGGFFLATILLLQFGPLDWQIKNPGKVYPFLIACLGALILGYWLAVGKKSRPSGYDLHINVSTYLIFAAAVSLLVYFPTVYVSTGKWFPDVYTGITNTGLAYQIAKYYSVNAPKGLFYLRMLLAPITMSVMPITLYYSKVLTKKAFWLGVLVICLNVCLSIAQGVNKLVADVAMQTVLTLCILWFAEKGEKKWPNRAKYTVAALLICVGFIFYYANTMSNRVSTDMAIGDAMSQTEMTEQTEPTEQTEQSRPSTATKPTQGELEKLEHTIDQHQSNQQELNNTIEAYSTFSVAVPKENTVWDKVIPQRLKPMVQYMISYFCHGYYGLSLAMEEDFTSSYGLGFSDFLRHNALRFFGGQEAEDQVFARTYMAKLENKGWPNGLVWSSFFVYPASDITFFGTVLLVALIGFLMGLAWKDTICAGNVFAVTTFMSFCTMIFYFSANNQVFQTGEATMNFMVNFILWMVTRTICRKKAK